MLSTLYIIIVFYLIFKVLNRLTTPHTYEIIIKVINVFCEVIMGIFNKTNFKLRLKEEIFDFKTALLYIDTAVSHNLYSYSEFDVNQEHTSIFRNELCDVIREIDALIKGILYDPFLKNDIYEHFKVYYEEV